MITTCQQCEQEDILNKYGLCENYQRMNDENDAKDGVIPNKYKITEAESAPYGFKINDELIKEQIFQEEKSNYKIESRDELIDNLIDWISEANKDKELMKQDLKYLLNLEDEFIFSSILTNEYIAFSDNPERFNKIAEDILELNSSLI